jgi:hypothetical protein
MSWSVTAIGRPKAVKESLAKQFENAKRQTAHIPEEQKSVETIEQLVNTQLDFADSVGSGAVQVSASGSCSKGSGSYPGATQMAVDLKTIYGFVE